MLPIQLTPFESLITPRLLLRQISSEDSQEILFLNSEPNVMKFLDREYLNNIEEAGQMVHRIQSDIKNNRGIMWGITLMPNQKIIGLIGFWRIIKEHHRAEIGFLLAPEHWGKGIMTEAVLKVVDYGFCKLNLHSIEGNVNPNNAVTILLLEKLGFVREGHFKENYFFNGKFLDSLTYSLLNK